MSQRTDLLMRVRHRFATGAKAKGIQGYIAGDDEILTPAAVLIPIVLRAEGTTILLTQRTDHLRDHAGQVSFPGGRCEANDASAHATALREAEEEVGLNPAQVEIIGELAQYSTGTGFVITPVVGLVTPPLNLQLDEFEVAKVFEPPLAFLMDSQNFEQKTLEFRGRTREYWAANWEDQFIWGATAAMLLALSRFLSDGEQSVE